ncbi:hypothetical protein [Paraflavitalea speifideaquila]|uniref:hypothetical protein n=1 Tax=Paraflavitalea speifideaquila TaxID=3076558 RepID=UPI0028E993C6|nr:hypothetical protein [Paraflavitalea speifideiaquila]
MDNILSCIQHKSRILFPLTLYDEQGKLVSFPEPQYRYTIPVWKEATQPVAMNTAGQATSFYPAAVRSGKNELCFAHESKEATITALWKMDKQYEGDILVNMSLIAKQDGYYSLSSPSLAIVDNKDLAWGMVPGYFRVMLSRKIWLRLTLMGRVFLQNQWWLVSERPPLYLPLLPTNKVLPLL